MVCCARTFFEVATAVGAFLAAATASPVERQGCYKSVTQLSEGPYLQAYGAGNEQSRTPGPILEDKTSFCATKDEYPEGLTVYCLGIEEGKHEVEFYVDGEILRTEKTAPYSIAGDRNGKSLEWLPPAGEVTIKCIVDGDKSVEATVDLSCDIESESGAMETGEPTTDATTSSPTEETTTTEAANTPTEKPAMTKTEDATTPKELFTEGPTTTKAVSPMEATTRKATTAASQPETVQTEPDMKPGTTKCVRVDASAPDGGTIPAPWERVDDGLLYGRNYDIKTIDDATNLVSYTITLPVESNYALTLDWTTSDTAEFNDVFGHEKETGLRQGVDGDLTTSPSKIFQSKASRAISARFDINHVKSNPMLGRAYKAGEKVTIDIYGRSGRVTVHSIILIPCSGEDCEPSSSHYKDVVATC